MDLCSSNRSLCTRSGEQFCISLHDLSGCLSVFLLFFVFYLLEGVLPSLITSFSAKDTLFLCLEAKTLTSKTLELSKMDSFFSDGPIRSFCRQISASGLWNDLTYLKISSCFYFYFYFSLCVLPPFILKLLSNTLQSHSIQIQKKPKGFKSSFGSIYESIHQNSLHRSQMVLGKSGIIMIQRQFIYKKIQIQRLLDEQSRLEGQLNELECKIQERELEYLSNSWIEGDYLLGWQKMEPMATKKALNISPKDKKFSLSSVFSRPSQELLSLEVKKLAAEKAKGQQKKKKCRKGKKAKISKRKKPQHKKK